MSESNQEANAPEPAEPAEAAEPDAPDTAPGPADEAAGAAADAPAGEAEAESPQGDSGEAAVEPAGADAGDGGGVADQRVAASEVAFEPLSGEAAPDGGGEAVPRNLSLLYDVPLQVTARLGSTRMKIKELLKLGPGAVVALDRLVGESVELLINGVVVGRGDVVVINDTFGLRITSVVNPEERLRSL